jgi:hypothetical protein
MVASLTIFPEPHVAEAVGELDGPVGVRLFGGLTAGGGIDGDAPRFKGMSDHEEHGAEVPLDEDMVTWGRSAVQPVEDRLQERADLGGGSRDVGPKGLDGFGRLDETGYSQCLPGIGRLERRQAVIEKKDESRHGIDILRVSE